MSSINSLLNHEPNRAIVDDTMASTRIPTTAYEAADALTTLASLGSSAQYATSPTGSAFPQQLRRDSESSFAPAVPVEPSPPVEQAHSPTLEHYHHGSSSKDQSPHEQRRRSLLMAAEPAPILPPLRTDSLPEQPELAHSKAAGSHQEPVSPSQALAPSENVDSDTLKAIEIAKQTDLGLRVKRNASVAESVPSPTEQKPAVPSKKRPAPSTTAMKKKGTATAKKPAAKKRKLDTDRDANPRALTPSSRASKPTTSKGGRKGSQAGTPAAESSPAPEHSSQVHPTDDEAESSEDTALYCICRKPDNHRWMIGCDGGCDDWFHGSCVNMVQSDEDLVDRFICPNCEEKGLGQTTWKPMCRREGCRKPARLTKGKESKYCSDECGTRFMADQLRRTAGAQGPKKRTKKKPGKQGEDGASDGEDDDEEPTPLGGVLRAKDVKALVDQSKDIQTFKTLGSGVLSPPRTASPTAATFDHGNLSNGILKTDPHLNLTAGETERLNALHKEISQLRDRLEVLKDREKFVSMVKDQASRIAEQEKMKAKDMCGYDSRLSWSDAEFLRWRNSRAGRAAFEHMTLSPSAEQLASLSSLKIEEDAGEMNGVETQGASGDAVKDERELVCLKKRCPKHQQWQKLNLQDARFEEVEIAESIRECEKEERSVRERAVRRGKKDAMEKELRA